MTGRSELYALLAASAPLAALVGNRIFPVPVPDETPIPCIGYLQSGGNPEQTLSGVTMANRSTIEVWCIADDGEEADEIGDVVQEIARESNFTVPTGRRPEYELEEGLVATVVTVDVWS